MKENNKDFFQQEDDDKVTFGVLNGHLIPLKKVKRVDYVIILIFILLFSFVASFFVSSSRPVYVANPISKTILKHKTMNLVEEDYPDFYENATINTNTGMLKSKSGYTVTCHQKNDTMSKITVYFDRKFNITKVAVNIKSQPQE